MSHIATLPIDPTELALVRACRAAIRLMLPRLVAELASDPAATRPLRLALGAPTLQAALLRHWRDLLSGEPGRNERRAATMLGVAFAEHGVALAQAAATQARLLAVLTVRLGLGDRAADAPSLPAEESARQARLRAALTRLCRRDAQHLLHASRDIGSALEVVMGDRRRGAAVAAESRRLVEDAVATADAATHAWQVFRPATAEAGDTIRAVAATLAAIGELENRAGGRTPSP